MNYEAEFGTDWERLDRDEALRRAYALGVAAHLGEDLSEEYERVQDAADTAYDRELLDLAYEEGESKAATASAQGATSDADVWEAVKPDSEGDSGPRTQGDAPSEGPDEDAAGPAPGPMGESRDRTSLPPAMTDDGLPEGSPDRLDLPAFLRR